MWLTDPSERQRLLRSAIKDIGRIFIVACVLDTTYQLLVFRWFYPGEMLIVAVVCAILPYVVVRGLVTRLARMLYRRGGGGTETSAAAMESDAEGRGKQESIHE